MRLRDVAKHFDQLPCMDAYSGDGPLFYGQFSPFDDSMRDGLTVERRILSVAPDTVTPSRGVVTAGDKQWIIGEFAPDYFGAEAIRHKYVVQGAEGLATLQTVAEVLAEEAGITAYTSLVYVKSAKQIEVSSDQFDQYNAYFSLSESIPERLIIYVSGKWYMARTSFKSAAGFRVALVSELEGQPIETITVASRNYNPVTDTYTGTPSTVTCIRIRWQDAFTYLTKDSTRYERGDLQVFLPAIVNIKAQDSLALSDGTWKVLSVLTEDGYKSAHLRRA